MEWVNLHIPVLRSPEYIGSDPVSRAAWINVLAYCCEQENGGIICGAAHWKDRQWQQACGVKLREVQRSCRLLRFDGENLVVNGYPTNKENHVKQARKIAMAGAMARWGKRHAERHENGNAGALPNGNAEGKGTGREQEEVNTPNGVVAADSGGDLSASCDELFSKSELPEAAVRKAVQFEAVVAAFNRLCPSLPSVRELTDKRRASIRRHWTERVKSGETEPLKWFEALFERVEKSPFLSGNGERSAGHSNWRASLEFILRSDVSVKIGEGYYDDIKQRAGSNSQKQTDGKITLSTDYEALRKKHEIKEEE